MGKKASGRVANAAAETNDDAVAAALAMIDNEMHGTADVDAEIMAMVEDIEGEGEGGSAFVEPTTEDEGVGGIVEGETEAADETVAEEADEEVEPDEGDMDAALAELSAEADNQASAPKKSGKAKSTAPKQPKAPPVPTREFTSVASIDPTTLKTNLDGLTAKKVIEKAQNVIQAIETGKRVSRYTADAVRHLQSAGHVTSKSLVEKFLSEGLSDGTARAQAQQMTALFKVLGIAMPSANNSRELVINDAPLVDELVKLAA